MQFGLCGTPGESAAVDRLRVGFNAGQQTNGRNDPARAGNFMKIKVPGAIRYARKESGGNALLDYRSFFWCKGADDDFIKKANEDVEHPSRGQRYWNFLETGERGQGKFRALMRKAKGPAEAEEPAPTDDKKTPDKNDESPVKADPAKDKAADEELAKVKKLPAQEAKPNADPDQDGKTDPKAEADDDEKKPPPNQGPADPNNGAKVDKADAEKVCAAKGIKKVNKKTGKPSEAWHNCVEDVQLAGGDKEGADQVLKGALDEEKDDDDATDAVETDNKEANVKEAAANKEGAKRRDDAVAPIVEVCPMGDNTKCQEVVALPAATFDKKEWNTVKVVLPVQAGDRVQIRFRQKQTDCECCNDFGIDSLQFLTGPKCAPGAINAD
jgi:hypothetical protein